MRGGRAAWAAVLLLVASVAWGQRPSVGNSHASFRVSPLNTLDAMRGNKTGVSPQCTTALARYPPHSNAAARAELFSGRLTESLEMIFSLFPPGSLFWDLRHQAALATTRLGIFNSLGKPEACRDYYLPGFHYCRITIFEPVLRMGVCVPKECDGGDVLRGAMPPIVSQLMQADVPYICGEHHYPPTAGTYAMSALLLLLGAMALAGTLVDLRARGVIKLGEAGPESSGRVMEVVKAFSLVTNWEVLVRPTRHDTFTVLDGVRSLSVLWMMFGHAFIIMLIMNFVTDNERALISGDFSRGFMQRWSTQILPAGYLSVCCFLFLSAFLGTYHMLQHLDKLRARGRWAVRFLAEIPAIYLHRFLRLSPSYYLTLGVYYWIASTLVTSTPFPYLKEDLQVCRRYWWMNLLYINNLRTTPKPPDLWKICYLPSWYMAVDMQLYVLLPFLVLLGAWNRWAGLALCAALTAASVTTAYQLAGSRGWSPIAPDLYYQRFYDEFYVKPWFRAPAYLMGIMSGIVWVNWGGYYRGLVADSKRRVKNRVWAGITLGVGLTLLALTVYGPRRCVRVMPCDAPVGQTSAMSTLTWPGFMLGLILLLFLCFLELEGGLIRAVLSMRPLVLLARLTFCMYLVHFGLMLVAMSSEPGTYPFSEVRFGFDFVGYVAGSLVLALLLHLLVERPAANLFAMLGPKKRRKGNEEEATEKKATGGGGSSPVGGGEDGISDNNGPAAEGKAEP